MKGFSAEGEKRKEEANFILLLCRGHRGGLFFFYGDFFALEREVGELCLVSILVPLGFGQEEEKNSFRAFYLFNLY